MLPVLLAKTSKLKDREPPWGLQCLAKELGDLLGHRPAFALRAGLQLAIQAVRQVLDV